MCWSLFGREVGFVYFTGLVLVLGVGFFCFVFFGRKRREEKRVVGCFFSFVGTCVVVEVDRRYF